MKKPRRVSDETTPKELEATDMTSLQAEINAMIDACYAEIRRLSRPLEAEIQRLHELHNANCAATSRLPVEVLSMILGYLVSASKASIILPPMGWINFTHVCRLWRTTAINEPRLWTDLATCRSGWQQEMLIRARQAPVHLMVDSNPLSEQQVASAVIPFPERFKSLTWRDNSDELLKLVKPAPLLESVNIHLKSPAPLPAGFLGSYAPRLRIFYSRNVYVHLDAPLFSNLRVLSDYAARFLRCLAHLEQLAINIPAAMQADVVDSAQNVSVHALKMLMIGANCKWLVLHQFLESIRLDVLQRAFVYSNFDMYSRDRFPDDILKTLVTFFASCIGKKPDCLKIADSGATDFSYSDPLKRECYLQIQPLSSIPDLLSAELEVTSFHTNGGLFLKESRSVKQLHLEGGLGLERLVGLNPEPLPYPSLRQLHIQGRHMEPKSQMLPMMKRWLANRIALGAQIDELSIIGHNLTPKEIKSLSQSVSLVLVSEFGDEIRVPQGSQ
ncbi:hypothetical protein ONZ45_g15625 [Pleurotus djamor]|nr:hypothetical protein ONZ45_g15625 [Pleurotus djamor]